MSRLPQVSSSLTITDPLIKYQSLLATGVLSPSPNQHRLAHHLQKLYRDLKDYSPQTEYRARLSLLTQAIDSSSAHPKPAPPSSSGLAVPSHPIWRNPFFARLLTAGGQGQGKGRSLALTRVLTSRQAAVEIDSPRGLFLSGDVGTGKSMLLDLLAEGLPTEKKRRWHFSGFMLYALSRLEHFRKISEGKGGGEGGGGGGEYSLLWLGREMIETSPVLFLDEFQLPDRAASKILGNLFVVFFQLGGVLVASSNRMPEELERATGGYGEAERGMVGRMLGLGRRRRAAKGELFGATSDFAGFLEVLKARCKFWHMESRDWRRWEGVEVGKGEAKALEGDGVEGVGEAEEEVDEKSEVALRPAKYFTGTQETEEWGAFVSGAWQPARLVVYGRTVLVPRQRDGVSLWDFSELVHSFGPADYITLASNYHTFILDNVPILPLSMKNEARRFITFLDALYESRCKLIIRAAAGPDDLFFPETRRAASASNTATTATTAATEPHTDGGGDAVYSETIAEVFQDQTSPFRPNISSYNPDQDSDFGTEQDASRKVDFTDAGAFTGQDERFAYARAESRLWEMCGARWHARRGEGWWMPLPAEARHWEGREVSRPLRIDTAESVRGKIAKGDVSFGPVVELDGPVGLEGRNVTELWRREEERRAAGAEGSEGCEDAMTKTKGG
ncbi:AFG1-like ATPase-domain-containing protein [Coniochaeta sp. 2T2.1]|nr:AFG1-like ATPase-domain-containing protein [Coniochaeta sp. 2T2.1]